MPLEASYSSISIVPCSILNLRSSPHELPMLRLFFLISPAIFNPASWPMNHASRKKPTYSALVASPAKNNLKVPDIRA
jgi:uncharacterized membrane protein YcfT